MGLGLTSGQLIALWERGRKASSHARALSMFAHARPDVDPDAAAEISIGRRDAELIRLRCACYGPRAPAYLGCPHCGEGMGFTIDLEAVLELAPTDDPVAFELAQAPFWLRARLPSTSDLRAAGAVTQADAARRVLLERCVLEATRAGDRVDPGSLPESVQAALEAEFEARDPLSDLRFDQACPSCGERFLASFDMATYLWRELAVDARRVVQEVDVLARNYGWSEADILAMSRARRHTYLEVCGVR